MSDKIYILLPVGRMVQGDLYKPETKDADGRPLTDSQGNPRNEFYAAVAIPKNGTTDWKQTEWGQKIVEAAVAAWPQGQHQQPSFSWKVMDGDDQTPNEKGVRNCDREGFAGHWIVKMKTGYQPALYNANGTQQLVEPDAIKRGHYIECQISVSSNHSQRKPGMYINMQMIAHAAYGPVIEYAPDASAVGFGKSQLPAGASATPPSGVAQTSAMNSAPATPAAPAAAPAVTPAAPVPAPEPAVLQAPAAPPAAPAKQMTAKAETTYEAYVAAGWTDEQLIAHGLMVA